MDNFTENFRYNRYIPRKDNYSNLFTKNEGDNTLLIEY